MSRVGRKPVALPSDAKVAYVNGTVSVQGPKGKLDFKVDPIFKVEIKDAKVSVISPSNEAIYSPKHGLIRAIIQNMIVGVTKGYSKELEIQGVGFKAAVSGKKLVLNLGYSHAIDYIIPDGITVATPKPTSVVVSGIDKAKVGEVAAQIRDYYRPEPYKGKGVRYVGEYVKRKQGKTVA